MNKIMTTGLLFALSLRHIAPSLLGWNRFIAAREDFQEFTKKMMEDHKATFTEGEIR